MVIYEPSKIKSRIKDISEYSSLIEYIMENNLDDISNVKNKINELRSQDVEQRS